MPDGRGFSSRRQWRWAFASGQPWARRWAHETPSFRGLPAAKTEDAPAATPGGRRPMTTQERAQHAALVRWKKRNPLGARQAELTERRKKLAKAKAGGSKKPAAPPATGDERAAFLAGLGLDKANADALAEYLSGLRSDPPEAMALNRQAAEALQAMGLIRIRPGQEGAGSLSVDLTSTGKRLGAAMDKGDIAGGMRVVEKAHERAETRAAGDREKAARAKLAKGDAKEVSGADGKPDVARALGKPGEKPKAEAEKPKKGGGGGGGGKGDKEKKEPEAEVAKPDRAAERAQRAAETAEAVGLRPAEADALRRAAEGDKVDEAEIDGLAELGLVEYDKATDKFISTDAGRRALGALERGDRRGYEAALQDVRAARGRKDEQTARAQEREAARTTKEKAREAERAGRAQEREAARAQRDKERADKDAAREKAKTDKENQELDDLADDFRRGRRGLSLKEQRRLVRAGRASFDADNKFTLNATKAYARPWRWRTETL